MKRMQIHIEERLDDLLAAEAARRGTSKAALIRQAVAREFGDAADRDALDDLVGDIDAEPADDIDAVIYDRDSEAPAR